MAHGPWVWHARSKVLGDSLKAQFNFSSSLSIKCYFVHEYESVLFYYQIIFQYLQFTLWMLSSFLFFIVNSCLTPAILLQRGEYSCFSFPPRGRYFTWNHQKISKGDYFVQLFPTNHTQWFLNIYLYLLISQMYYHCNLLVYGVLMIRLVFGLFCYFFIIWLSFYISLNTL